MDLRKVPKSVWLVSYGKLCFLCGKPNHVQQCCRSKKNVNYMNSHLSNCMDNNYVLGMMMIIKMCVSLALQQVQMRCIEISGMLT